MKICMLSSSLGIGGAETHLLSLTEALLKRGHSVTVVTAGGILTPRESQARFIVLPLDKKRFAFSCIQTLRRLFQEENFDVVHAHARFPAFLAKLAGASPLVVTAHFPFSVAFPLRSLSVWGDKTLAVSPDIAAYLSREYRLPPERIFLTKNGIDTAAFAPAAAPKRRGFHIYHASRFDKDRSLAAFCLLEVLRLWEREDVFLHLIGDGEDFEALESEATLMNATAKETRVFLYGKQKDIAPLLQNADCFVGVSRAALEAMSMALPVILAGNEGFLSVFTEGIAEVAEQSNFCCRDTTPLTPALLLGALKQIFEAPLDKKEALGDYNRRYVLKRYAVSEMAKDAEAVYKTVAGEKKEAVLCGYYGFGNGGDEWMRYALYKRLEKDGYYPIHILSRRLFSRSTRRALRSGADFFLGGGNLLQDETSKRSLWLYTTYMKLARKGGSSVYLLSSGIGPLSKSGLSFARKALSDVKRIEARTRRDASHFAALVPRCPVYLSHDAALAYPFSPQKEDASLLLLVLKRPPLLAEYAFFSALALIVEENRALSPVILPLHPKDAAFCKRVGKRLLLSPEQIMTAPTTDLLPHLLPKARLLFSNRLHAGIAALAAGVPAYLFPENEKITSFYEDASAEAEAAGLPLPCRLLFDSSAKNPPIEAKKEDILRVKALLLERNGLFCPIKKK